MNYEHQKVVLFPTELESEHKETLLREAAKCVYASRACVGKKLEAIGTIEDIYRYLHTRIEQGHWSVMEHGNMQVEFVTSISIARELARHRLCAISQESTRYVRYLDTNDMLTQNDRECLDEYNVLLSKGVAPEDARDVLPLGWPTRIIITANLREWSHIYRVRSSKGAHHEMRELMRLLYNAVYEAEPAVATMLFGRWESDRTHARYGLETAGQSTRNASTTR